MMNIKLMNKIAAVGTDLLDRKKYNVGEDVAAPDAIMVRSAVLHDMEFNPELMAISRCGAGVNNIPIDRCSEAGIVVFNTPGANANGVKELAIAALIMAARDIAGGLAYAKEVGCHTVAISCNPGSAIGQAAELAIEVVPGPEVLTGSTRLKSGTSQKLILNMISTATMVGCGKAYQNLMVDVMQTNEKLIVRAQNIVMEATGCDRETAAEKIAIANGSAKTAITMILADGGLEEAKVRLEKAKGHVREAIR
jgi:lactate dehydrogenase-like 2-hydroxyacid dehydrogenase